MFTKFLFSNSATSKSSKLSFSITWHQWQDEYPTLKNIGLNDDELYSNIRVTLGSINNKSEIDKFLELIQICIDKF